MYDEMSVHTKLKDPVCITVVGASGDLATKKIFPALFSLFNEGLLPQPFYLFGYARTPMNSIEFRKKLAENLTCRMTSPGDCSAQINAFLERCRYVTGEYNSIDGFLDLYEAHKSVGADKANRVFFMAIPSSVFLDVARSIGASGLVACEDVPYWSRAVIEKPFGRDRESSDKLVEEMQKVFFEEQIYRMDHYLGKEVIQNLLVLRFANSVFEPIWNRKHIQSINITWKEDFGIRDRGAYFDDYGIIRDVMQNHLLQMLALIAMEKPAVYTPYEVGNAKVALLRSIVPLKLKDVVLGQYIGVGDRPSYKEERGVSLDSRTPTFATVTLKIKTPRWQGVPFTISAGKALDRSLTEIRVLFRAPLARCFCHSDACPEANELIIRVQPDAMIALKINNKVPGLRMKIVPEHLNLIYNTAFSEPFPDAYERLLLDVIKGDRDLFVRSDELATSWDVFTPLLGEIERRKVIPKEYPFGVADPRQH